MEWDEDRRDKLPCPACNHCCVMVEEDGDAKANMENRSRAETLRARTKEWNADSKSKRQAKKPTLAGGSVDATLFCMCMKMNCANRMDGHGCVVCENFAEAGARPPMDSATQKCVCAVCSCQCSVMFQRSERRKLAQQAAVEREKTLGVDVEDRGPGT